MKEILNEIIGLQKALDLLTMKFAEEGFDEDDAERAVEALNESLSINRVLYGHLKQLQEDSK